MRVWVDFTASAHPLVFRPLVERLQAQGHDVEITAREYAQTLQLIESHGMTATVIGHHGGRSSLGKATQPKLQQYPGLKEEYYLADFDPDPAVLTDWGIDPGRVLVVLRPPPDVS